MSNLENPVVQNYEFANAYDSLPVHGVILHKDFNIQIQDEALEAERKRFRGTMNTLDIPSFFEYVTQRSDEEGAESNRTFVDAADPMRSLVARTILNFGEYTKPGHCDDRAVLELRKDPLFTEFLDSTGGFLKPKDFAEALENFLGLNKVVAFNNSEDIGFSKTIQAIRNAKIDKNSTSIQKSGALQCEASDMEKVAIEAQEHTLPDEFTFDTPLYLGLETQTIRFRVVTHFKDKEQGGVEVFYRLTPIGLLAHYLQAAEYFQDVISERLSDVTIGTFQVGK